MRAARYESHVQYPALIGDYIADFAIPARKLVIEIDGGQHTATLESDLEGVLETIIAGDRSAPTSP